MKVIICYTRRSSAERKLHPQAQNIWPFSVYRDQNVKMYQTIHVHRRWRSRRKKKSMENRKEIMYASLKTADEAFTHPHSTPCRVIGVPKNVRKIHAKWYVVHTVRVRTFSRVCLATKNDKKKKKSCVSPKSSIASRRYRSNRFRERWWPNTALSRVHSPLSNATRPRTNRVIVMNPALRCSGVIFGNARRDFRPTRWIAVCE